MRYIVFEGSTDFAGTSYKYYEVYNDSVSDEFLDDVSYEYGFENAEDYLYLIGDDSEEAEQWYFENEWTSNWYEISKEEYDQFLESGD